MKKHIPILCFSLLSHLAFSQWTLLNSGTVNNIFSVSFPTVTTGYFMDDANILHKTTNGGSTWTVVNGSVAGTYVYFQTTTTGFVYGGPDILKTTNGGVTFTDVFADNILVENSLFFVNSNLGFASGENLSNDSILIYKTTNGGSSWTRISQFLSTEIGYSMFFTSATTGFLGCDFGSLYKTTDGGITWVLKLYDGNSYFYGMDFPTADTGYVVGAATYTQRSIDFGNTWQAQNNMTNTLFYSCDFINSRHGFVVGGNGFSNGVILETTDAGANWTVSQSSVNTFQSVCFPSTTIGYAGGLNGVLYKYSAPTGLEENLGGISINTYPNPSLGIFYCTAEKPMEKLDIFNITGELVYSTAGNGLESVQIDLSDKPQGPYILKVTRSDGMVGHQILTKE